MTRQLSFQDVEPLFQALSENDAVLIGGQALNLWCDVYQGRAPELADEGPFTSKDVDVQGSRALVTACARALGGRYKVADDMHDGTNAGYLAVPLGEAVVEINVLFGPFGVRADEAARTAIPVDTGSATLRVLNPVLCMEGRIANVIGLKGRDTEHDLRQARASIICAREFVVDVVKEQGARHALKLIERIYRFALENRHAKLAYARHGLDCFKAVKPIDGLPARFASQRYPQMRDRLATRSSNTSATTSG